MGGLRLRLLKKGAEADIFLAVWHEEEVVFKKRVAKKYRPILMDMEIRRSRTIRESQLIHEAKKAGVPTPVIFSVDMGSTTIVMQYLHGKQVKQAFNEVDESKRDGICLRIGELIGRLHTHGLIHGDLTTSNMIIDNWGKITFIDFGLGEKSVELELHGVDLHLMKRALQSTHYLFAEKCFDHVFAGYSKIVGANVAKRVLDKIAQIEKRGRYIAERRTTQFSV